MIHDLYPENSKLGVERQALSRGKLFCFVFPVCDSITNVSPFCAYALVIVRMFIRLFPSRLWRSYSLEDVRRREERSSSKV